MIEVLQTIFAGLTLAVFAATAWLAMVQLGHLRRSYQMTTASLLLQNYWTPQFQEWLHYVFFELHAKLESPEFRQELRAVPADKMRHPEIYVCEYFSLIGAYIKNGLMPEEIYLSNGSSDAIVAWRNLRPVVEIIREADSPFLYRDFETLAARCERYLIAHSR